MHGALYVIERDGGWSVRYPFAAEGFAWHRDLGTALASARRIAERHGDAEIVVRFATGRLDRYPTGLVPRRVADRRRELLNP